jgi:hypothetical protein
LGREASTRTKGNNKSRRHAAFSCRPQPLKRRFLWNNAQTLGRHFYWDGGSIFVMDRSDLDINCFS